VRARQKQTESAIKKNVRGTMFGVACQDSLIWWAAGAKTNDRLLRVSLPFLPPSASRAALLAGLAQPLQLVHLMFELLHHFIDARQSFFASRISGMFVPTLSELSGCVTDLTQQSLCLARSCSRLLDRDCRVVNGFLDGLDERRRFLHHTLSLAEERILVFPHATCLLPISGTAVAKSGPRPEAKRGERL
jgi:hypothetical protein